MLKLTKKPSDYTEKILFFLLCGDERSTSNLLNFNECLHWVVLEDSAMLSPERFKNIIRALMVEVKYLDTPDEGLETQMRQVIVGNLLFKFDKLLSCPQGKALHAMYRHQFREILAKLVDHFLTIHHSYEPKDDRRLFQLIARLYVEHDSKFIVDVDMKNLDRFIKRCESPSPSESCALSGYHGSMWSAVAGKASEQSSNHAVVRPYTL
ncbi:MAG: hypothetical protein P1U40_08525 [Coxiellaceae bacterium]|nr:hypothetical protein [Coxiellaceae bacterium]